MKKLFLLSAVALMGVCFAACEPDNTTDLDNAVEDGFYVAGAATGSADLAPVYMMTTGVNEDLMNNGKKTWAESKRAGMYEKYLVLDANKDFELLLYEAGKKTRYSATLETFTPAEGSTIYGDDPQMAILKGELVTGSKAPAMKVTEKGLYHIVLDLNTAGDLAKAQIIVAPVEWGVRGGMNSWGWTKMEAETKTDGSIVYTITDAEMAKNAEFKFAYGGAWKITLDDAGKVRAHTNLGHVSDDNHALQNGGANIKVGDGGKYTFTLTFKLAAGEIGKSYSYTMECTEKSQLPEEMYMIGEGIEGWNLGDKDGDGNPQVNNAVAMHPFHSQPGMFWAIRYIEAGKGFKFSTVNTGWGSDFASLGDDDSGFAVADGNCSVAESGIYCLGVDYANSKIVVEPAKVYGMGEAFGGWNKQTYAFTVDGQTLVSPAVTVADKAFRSYVDCSLLDNTDNWWHAEFVPFEGGIQFREAGGNPAEVKLNVGQKVVYDFNAGTSAIR